MNHQYDVIVIGTGEKTKSTADALRKQGQQVMYIELTPEMLATMVCHHPKKNNSSSQEFDTEKENGPMKTKIHLQQQTVQSSAGEIITYTFHVEESVEITEVEQLEVEDHNNEDDLSKNHTYLYQPTDSKEQNIEPIELELLDDYNTHEVIDAEIMDEAITYYEDDSDSNLDEMDHVLYEIDDQPIEEKHETIDFTEEVTPTIEDESDSKDYQQNSVHSLTHSLKPSTLSQQREREHELREKLIRRKGKTETPNLLTGDYQDRESFEESNSMQTIYDNHEKNNIDRSTFLQSVLSKPSYSPRESRLRKRLSFKPKTQPPAEMEKATSDHSTDSHRSQSSPTIQEDHPKKQKVYSFEPFSSRRRARVHKKNRMLTTVERFKPTPKPMKQIEEQHDSFTQDDYENQDLSFQQAYTEESSSSQLISNTDEHLNAYESTQIDSNSTIQPETTADNLKKDTIEMEDPYGEYNSFEDFLPPYSQNNRKRQEMDEIEKRKIALRGLHNLINNLG